MKNIINDRKVVIKLWKYIFIPLCGLIITLLVIGQLFIPKLHHSVEYFLIYLGAAVFALFVGLKNLKELQATVAVEETTS